MNSLRTLARQFIQFAIALVFARDVGRVFDATPHAEFLCECVRKPIKEDLPRETEFLGRYDRFQIVVETIADMPDRTIDLLFRSLHQNGGSLSKRAREREFSKLTEAEVNTLEEGYAEIFRGHDHLIEGILRPAPHPTRIQRRYGRIWGTSRGTVAARPAKTKGRSR